jgi:hypothetical protein
MRPEKAHAGSLRVYGSSSSVMVAAERIQPLHSFNATTIENIRNLLLTGMAIDLLARY